MTESTTAAIEQPASSAAPDWVRELVAGAVQDERARCIALLELSTPEYQTLVIEAIKAGLTVEQAAQQILFAMRDRGVSLTSMQVDATAVPFVAHAEPASRGSSWKRAAMRAARVPAAQQGGK